MADSIRILIVDDEEAIRFFATDSLARQGWAVHEADSGEAALALLAETPCDLIFLDLRLEGMSGLETMHRIKARWPGTLIIIMTAYATLDSAIEAVRQGAMDYLRKPCSAGDLELSVRQAIARRAEEEQPHRAARTEEVPLPDESGAEPDSVVKTGSLVIDPGARRVMQANRSLSLTPTEYELLALLAQTPGRPVSAELLVQQGLGYQPQDAQALETLRVHISRLRRKLGSDYIVTARGGYALAKLPPGAFS